MAERGTQRARRRPAKAGASDAPLPATPRTSAPDEDTVQALRDELEQARASLAAAHRRIAALEAARDEVLNRIDWVIDSLHSLRDEER